MCRVKLENFPTRNEVLQILDNFLDAKGYDKNYSLNNADNVVEVLLKETVIYFLTQEIAKQFITHLDQIKEKNNLYAKLKVTISFDSNKPIRRTILRKFSILKIILVSNSSNNVARNDILGLTSDKVKY
jgi:predicted lactoylglutathione lyase